MSIANEIIKFIVYIQANTARAGSGTKPKWQLHQSFALRGFISSAPAWEGLSTSVQPDSPAANCLSGQSWEGRASGLVFQQVYLRKGFTHMCVFDHDKPSDLYWKYLMLLLNYANIYASHINTNIFKGVHTQRHRHKQVKEAHEPLGWCWSCFLHCHLLS